MKKPVWRIYGVWHPIVGWCYQLDAPNGRGCGCFNAWDKALAHLYERLQLCRTARGFELHYL